MSKRYEVKDAGDEDDVEKAVRWSKLEGSALRSVLQSPRGVEFLANFINETCGFKLKNTHDSHVPMARQEGRRAVATDLLNDIAAEGAEWEQKVMRAMCND